MLPTNSATSGGMESSSPCEIAPTASNSVENSLKVTERDGIDGKQEEESIEITLKTIQQEHYEQFGGEEFMEFPHENELILQVGCAIFGGSTEDGESQPFSMDILKIIMEFTDKIHEISDLECVRMSFLFVVGEVESNIISVPVFKILTSNGTVFLDHHLQTYHCWEKFIKENNLPKGLYAYPQDGIYQADDTGRVLLMICPSSCNTIASKAIIIGEIVTVVSIGAVVTSLLFAEAAPLALAIGAGCGLYRVIQGSLSIHNLRKNKESLSLFDKTARGHWLSVIGSIIEVISGLGSAGVACLARGLAKGERLLLAIQDCVKVLKVSSFIVASATAIENVGNVIMKSGIVELIKQSFVNFGTTLVNSFRKFFLSLKNIFTRNSPQSYNALTVSNSFEEEITEVKLEERDLSRKFEESSKEIHFEMSEDLKSKLQNMVESYFGSNKACHSSALIRHSENLVQGQRSTTQEDCMDVYSLFLIYMKRHLREMVRAYENKKIEKKKLLGENFDESLFDKEYGIQCNKSKNEWFEHYVMKKIKNSSENLMEKFDLTMREIIAINDDGGMKFCSSLKALKEFFRSSVIDGQELCPKEFFNLIRESIANEENCEIVQFKNGKIYSECSIPVHIKVVECDEGSFFKSVSFMN